MKRCPTCDHPIDGPRDVWNYVIAFIAGVFFIFIVTMGPTIVYGGLKWLGH